MLYRLCVPHNKKSVLDIMDSLVSCKQAEIHDVVTARNVGRYIKPWRNLGLVSFYIEPEQNRRILVSNVDISKNIKAGKKVEFTIDERLISGLFIKTPRL